MTTLTKADTIRRIYTQLVELIPEIVELKFGCQVMLDDEAIGTILFEDALNRLHILSAHGPVFRERAIGREVVEQMEVLGRPIRLADIAYALTKKYIAFLPDKRLELLANWDPLNDDLTLQDGPTIEFIHKTLK